MAVQIPSASTNAYENIFFPWTIRDWNNLPDSLISFAELSEDCMSMFSSLVRAMDLFPPVTALGEGCHLFGVSPVR